MTMKTAYSKTELQEFKELIESKLQVAQETYKSLSEEISKTGNSASDTNWQFGSLEDGSDTTLREEINIVAARQKKFIESLQNALIRINNRTYGICRVSGELIPKNRLLAVPNTTTCIQSKNL